MGMTAMNHIYYFSTTIYVMYMGVIILLALPFFATPGNIGSTAIWFSLMLLLPWSGPYSVIAVPVVLAMILLFPDDKKKWLLLLVGLLSTLAYFLFAVEDSSSKITFLKNWWIIKLFFHVLLDKIIFMKQFDYVEPWLWLPVLLAILLCFFLFHKDKYYIRFSLVMFGIIISSLALFFLSSKFPSYKVTSDCHRVISLYFWCFYLLYTADRFFIGYGWGKISSALLTAAVLFLILYDNHRFPRKRWIEGIPDSREFLSAVRQLETVQLDNQNAHIIVQLDNYQKPYFLPKAMIGNRHKNSIQLTSDQVPPEKRSRFILDKPLPDMWYNNTIYLPTSGTTD